MSEPAKKLAKLISSGEWSPEEIKAAYISLINKGDIYAAAALQSAAAEINLILKY